MDKAKINGYDLEYSVKGAKSENWVVFIHGSVFEDMFVPVMSNSALSDYSISHYHRSGYGDSDYNKSSPPSINELSSECLNLMKSLDIERAHIVSHSFAGLIALQAAVDDPKKVHSLTLMEPPLAGFVTDGAEFGKKLENSFNLYQQGKKFESLDSFLKVVFEGTEDYRKIIDTQLGDKAFDKALSILDTLFQLEFPALLKWRFDTDNAKSMKLPILSVRGSDSATFFKQVNLLLQTWFPHLETLDVPNASHILHMQDPELVAKGLESFFSRHPI